LSSRSAGELIVWEKIDLSIADQALYGDVICLLDPLFLRHYNRVDIVNHTVLTRDIRLDELGCVDHDGAVCTLDFALRPGTVL
jgi:hypothetical protein